MQRHSPFPTCYIVLLYCNLARIRSLRRKRLKVARLLCNRMNSTYTPPIAKTPIRSCFWRRLRLSLRMTGIGRTMIARSVTMFIAALKNHMINWSMHRALGSFVQKAETGTNWRVTVSGACLVFIVLEYAYHMQKCFQTMSISHKRRQHPWQSSMRSGKPLLETPAGIVKGSKIW